MLSGGAPIAAADTEYEVDLPRTSAAVRLHQPCLIVWDNARKDVGRRHSVNAPTI